MARITAPDFQFEGTAAESLTMTYSGATKTGSASGTIKVKHHDMAVSITSVIDGKTSISETRAIGIMIYTRTDGGSWKATIRAQPPATSVFDALSAYALRDMGLGTFHGKRLRRLVATSGFILDPTLTDASGIESGSGGAQLTFWASANGTPAGMTLHLRSASGADLIEINLDYTFIKLSGVTITAPI